MICFHNPDEENGYLSNWYLSDFTADNIKFSSMEQYMMYSKAILFKDYSITEEIIKIHDVSRIKALGRIVKNFNEYVWVHNREKVIENGLYAKFSQNVDLGLMLVGTGDDILAECAVRDTIWGIGLSMNDKNRFDTSKWRGLNLLGKCLMNVRARLKDENKLK